MSGRRLRSLGVFSDEQLTKLENVGWGKCKDALLQDVVSVAEVLGESEARTAQLIKEVARKVRPSPAQMLSLTSTGRIPTGIPTLDNMIKGGLPVGVLAEVVGQPGIGKSQFLMTAAAKGTTTGNVLYVDTEGKFSYERLSEIAGEPTDDRVLHCYLPTLELFMSFLEELELQVEENCISLVIIDSIAAIIRVKDLSPVQRSQLLVQLATTLKLVAARFSLVVLLSNQVTMDNIPALGNTWHHAVNYRFQIYPLTPGLITSPHRILALTKSPVTEESSFRVIISERGIVEHIPTDTG
eukprot:TRINITY_DN25599_c0_g1_i1.p1 TRINITY_DN25599_c0_g1~~TRINITY_DN25599_c0_g1_i1.p1  ORF type:complete len:297 (+),score=45.18 TRINITY_DN25599_c0_g1_i1:31-921(+)